MDGEKIAGVETSRGLLRLDGDRTELVLRAGESVDFSSLLLSIQFTNNLYCRHCQTLLFSIIQCLASRIQQGGG